MGVPFDPSILSRTLPIVTGSVLCHGAHREIEVLF